MAAQRLAYRFLASLVSRKILLSIPLLARKWTQLDTDSCMYSEKMHKLTSWEIEACPWWIDMEKGHVLACERDLRDAMLRDTTSKAIGATSETVLLGAACAVHPLESASRPGHSSSGASVKGKEAAVEAVVGGLMEEARRTSHDIGGSSQLCHVLAFGYPDDISMHSQISHDFDRCVAVIRDYIAISRDFSSGVRSPSWAMIHEHMLKVQPRDLVYRWNGKSVAWAADFIFLDLPYGGLISVYDDSPMWDRITEDHVCAGIHLA